MYPCWLPQGAFANYSGFEVQIWRETWALHVSPGIGAGDAVSSDSSRLSMDLSGLGRSALKENKIAQNSPNSQNVLLELILTALETGHNTRKLKGIGTSCAGFSSFMLSAISLNMSIAKADLSLWNSFVSRPSFILLGLMAWGFALVPTMRMHNRYLAVAFMQSASWNTTWMGSSVQQNEANQYCVRYKRCYEMRWGTCSLQCDLTFARSKAFPHFTFSSCPHLPQMFSCSLSLQINQAAQKTMEIDPQCEKV